jgi:predicted enzyme related to lactoylglutathione lyase
MPSGPYHLFKDGDRFRAGMMAITLEMGPMPPNWSVYFTVDDIDAALEGVRSLGGAVEAEITPAPGVGKIAVVRSADGAYFDLMQPE